MTTSIHAAWLLLAVIAAEAGEHQQHLMLCPNNSCAAGVVTDTKLLKTNAPLAPSHR
jgi:hypothetical protein